MDLERNIEVKKAIPVLLGIGALLFLIGMLVGKLVFWNDFDTVNPVEKDIAYYEALIEKKPRNDALIVELGWLYYQQGNYLKASELLGSAKKINEGNMKARYCLGLALQELGKAADAEDEYKKVLEYDPGHKPALHSLGRLYVEQKRWEDAVKQLEYACKVDPASADNCYYLGLAYENKGFADEAKAAYEKALKMVPNYKEAEEALNRLNNLK